MRVRGWRPGDERAVGALLDPGADALWVDQFHALHGPGRGGARWRSTVVATVEPGGGVGELVVGAASVAANAVHPGRCSCAIEVHPAWRRRAVGSALLAAVRAARPHPVALSGKVRPHDGAALRFLAAGGGGVYQRCPGQVIDPGEAAVRSWVADRLRAPAGVEVDSLEDLDGGEVAAAFAEQYLWVHALWSPVPVGAARTALGKVAASVSAQVDRVVSSGAWWRGRLVVMAAAFPAAGGWEVVAETVIGDPASVGMGGGRAVGALAAALARTVDRASVHGGGLVELDGHVSDPHLQPALVSLPTVARRPLLLVHAP